MGWLIVLAGVLAAALLPTIIERRKTPIGRAQRVGQGFQFAELSQGVTAYRWHGPTRGPVIVAVHGLTTPSQVWDDLVPLLVKFGYRVVTYDLYGRGLSDAPTGEQSGSFFQKQLSDLLDHLELNEDIILMGYSMGGAIVTGYAAAHPHQVSKVILVAGAGIDLNETGLESLSRRVPVFGDWLNGLLLERHLRKGLDPSPDAHPINAIVERQFERQGYIPAVLSSRRNQLAEVQRSQHEFLGKEDLNVIAVWGDRDEVIPISALGKLAQWNRLARQEVIPDAGHSLLQTNAKEVSAAITRLLAL